MLISKDRCINIFGEDIADYIESHESVNCWYSLYIHIVPKEINGVRDRYYIGTTEHLPRKRWGKDGMRYKGHPFYNAILEYGWDNMEHIVISCSLSKDDVLEAEGLCIEYTNSCDPEFGYNAQSGDGTNPSQLKPVYQFDGYGNLLKKYSCINEASREMGCNSKTISVAATTGWEFHGYLWSFDSNSIQSFNGSRKKPS